MGSTFKETLQALDRAKKPKPRPKKVTSAENLAKARAVARKNAAERRAKLTTEELLAKTQRRKESVGRATLKYQRTNRPLTRDIGLFEVKIDWERRLRCKSSLKTFCEVYLAPVFYHGWSSDQL